MIWTVKEDDIASLKDFLKARGVSRRLLSQVKQEPGTILVNGQMEKVTKSLNPGDLVTFKLPKEPAHPLIKPVEKKLKIVFEDDYLLVVNKEPGVPTLSNPQNKDQTLANYLTYYYKTQHYDHQRIHPVTRLDKDTSGLIVFAKNGFIHHLMAQLSIDKGYQALVFGHLEKSQGIIDLPIGRKPGSIIERQVKSDGRPAQTKYRVLETRNNYSLVDINLLTGRTHQIRVHFSHLGHPLLGDDLYGGAMDWMKRQALHAKTLAFDHPITDERVDLQTSLPEDMAQLL